MPDANQIILRSTTPFLFGDSETGRLANLKNWAQTPLGNIDTWPQTLRTTIAMLSNTPVAMCLYWGPQMFCFYNASFYQQIAKYNSHLSIMGMPAAEAGNELWPAQQPLINQVLQNGKAISTAAVIRKSFKNDLAKNVYYTVNYSPINDEDGKAAGVLAIYSVVHQPIAAASIAPAIETVTDTTASRHTNETKIISRFKESEKVFRNLVMEAPVGIIVLKGANFVVEMANKKYLELVIKSEAEFVGFPLFTSLPEIKDTVESLLINVFTTGQTYTTPELAVPLNRHGKTALTYFNVVYQPLRDDDQFIWGIIVIANEITEVVEARLKLKEDEKEFRNMVMQSPIPMAIFRGKDHVVEMANIQMFTNIWRKGPAETVGKKLLDIFPELIGQKYPQIFDDVFEKGISVKENEALAYITGHDGTKKFYLDYEYTPLFETSGVVSGMMVTVNDVTEKVEVKQRLEEGEARLRLATEGTKLATWDLNLETMDMVHSPRLAEIFGHPAPTMLTRIQMNEFIHKDDVVTIVEKAFEEAMKTSVYNYEARIIWPDETVHWIRTQGKVIYDEKGVPFRMIGTLIDITESKKTEVEIGRLAAIVQSSGDAIISKSLEGIIATWNDAAEKMLGYKSTEVIGKSVLILIPPDRIGEEGQILSQIKKGLRVSSFETKRITKDRRILDISLTISPIKNALGQIIGASKIARDITRQKIIEAKVAASEEKFRLLANSMAQLIWTGDPSGNLTYFNQAVYEYAGLNFNELRQKGWLNIVHPDDRDANIKAWQHSMETGEDFIFEHRFLRHDGEYRWQLSRALPQKDSQGKIQMWVGTSTDIHDIKESEQQKDFFISMASHELKTPITSIKGYVQILMSMYKDNGDDFLKRSLQIVDKQIVTLTTLIGDLLDVSKIKSGSLQLSKEHFYMNDLIQEIVDEVLLIQPNAIVHFSSHTVAKVCADKGRIGQVLINLLTNAIKYSPNSNEVYVEDKITADGITVTVTDAGIGISKPDQKRIFQRFYRVAGKDEKTFPGFGIGLFIAAEIVHRHNGKIGVDSEPGKGSVFYFSLPLDNTI